LSKAHAETSEKKRARHCLAQKRRDYYFVENAMDAPLTKSSRDLTASIWCQAPSLLPEHSGSSQACHYLEKTLPIFLAECPLLAQRLAPHPVAPG
jgi:hypothetical protein